MGTRIGNTPDAFPRELYRPLVARLPRRFRPLFADRPVDEGARLYSYFFTVPKDAGSAPCLRSHLISFYDPFADQAEFPSGFRYVINVYTGCAFLCTYCYIANYIPRPWTPRAKRGLLGALERDLGAIEALGLPPLPLHISNSTDPLQPIEAEHRSTLRIIEALRGKGHLFSTITLLTKNPSMLLEPEYRRALERIKGVRVEVSVAFLRDDDRLSYERRSPPVTGRLRAVEGLRRSGIPVSLRIDPLFPRDPLPPRYFSHGTVDAYGCPPTPPIRDIEGLIEFARENRCERIIVSPLKVPCGRYASTRFARTMRRLFAAVNGGRVVTRSFAYRMDPSYVRDELIGPVLAACARAGMKGLHCKESLIRTR